MWYCRSQFKAMAIVGNVTYYCERVDVGWPLAKQGLIFTTNADPDNFRLGELNIKSHL
jgi:hypothetical protein